MSYQTEEEQLAAIGQLWKKYGNKILAIIVLIAIAIYGYRAWMNHEKAKDEQASALYGQLSQLDSTIQTGHSLTKEQMASFKHIVSLLKKDHPGSIYTQFADLLMAKQAIANDKSEEAKSALSNIISISSDTNIKTLATIRLATILTGEGEKGAKAALSTLKKITQPGAFAIDYNNVSGDAYLALKQTEKARAAYQKALAIAKKEDIKRPLIQIKLDNLAQPEEAHK